MAEKNKLAQLANIVQEMENKVSRGYTKHDSQVSVLHQLGELEESLRVEISRRADMERRIAEGVDGKIKIAVDRLADAVEMEMTRMYRKMDLELTTKLDAISDEVKSLQAGRMTVMERRIDDADDLARRTCDAVTRLDGRLTAITLELSASATAPLAVEQARLLVNEAVTRVHTEIDEALHDIKRIKVGMDKQITDLRVRLEFETANIRADLHAEADFRDSADKELADVVTQYAEVMHRKLSS